MTTLLTIITWASFIAFVVGLIKPAWVKMPSRGRSAWIFALAWVTSLILLGIASAAAPHGFFAFLSIVGLLALIVGLIKPKWLRMPDRKKVALYYGLGFFIIFMIGVAVSGVSLFSATTPSGSPTQQSPNAGPETSQQKLQDVINSALPPSWTFGSITLASDTSYEQTIRPADAQFVKVTINAGDAWDDTAIITESGQLATKIFQQAFQIDPTYYDVGIEYDGQLTDQYGNTTTSQMIYYEMDRELDSKINWDGLSTVQNDVHMCAFLREQENQTQSDAAGRSIGCLVIPNDIRQAENTIESQNASQYPDIPHYGN
jgi:hypothetical protein